MKAAVKERMTKLDPWKEQERIERMREKREDRRKFGWNENIKCVDDGTIYRESTEEGKHAPC